MVLIISDLLKIFAGISIYNSDVVIDNCNIIDNHLPAGGGAINCAYSTVRIYNCLISNNLTNVGGGIDYFRKFV